MHKHIKWFWQFYRDYPKVLIILLVLTPLQAAVAVMIPRLLGFTVDLLETGVVPDHWLSLGVSGAGEWFGLTPAESFAAGFVVIGLISFIMYAYFQSWRAWMNCRLEFLFRQHAFDRITTKGPDFYNHFRTGDLVTRMTDDVAEKLSWFACSGIFRTYEALLNIGFVILMMISIDSVLTLWTTGPLPILIVIFFISSSLLDKRYDALQKRISSFNDIIEACLSGIRVVKAYVREDAQQAKFAEAARERRQAEIDSVKVTRVVDSLYNYIWQFGVVIVLIAGGYRVLSAGLTIGSLATFIYYVVWLIFPMFDIGQFLVKSRQSAVSVKRLRELEDVPAMVDDSEADGSKVPERGHLELSNIDFSFSDKRRPILEKISLEIQPGSTVAFVGRVGSGKSWLINLVPRLVDPTGGRIMLDGHDLRSFRLEDLRRSIGYVPQESVLFSDSVRNNIVFGREDISESAVDWAIDVAQLRSEIDSFPDGLDTEIGVRGMSISGGQKQRLALARALVSKPRILILDDCTSALDSDTETALWERLHEVMPELTALLITHRPDTLQKVDKLFVLKNGRVVESGCHDELIAAGGEYAAIYKQFELEEQVTA